MHFCLGETAAGEAAVLRQDPQRERLASDAQFSPQRERQLDVNENAQALAGQQADKVGKTQKQFWPLRWGVFCKSHLQLARRICGHLSSS